MAVRSAEPRFGVAREGWPLVLALALPALAALLLGRPLLGAAALALPLIGALYFREADGEFPAAPSSVYAPLSGRVLSVRRLRSGPGGEPALRVRLRVAWLGGYALRAPVDGQVQEPAPGVARGAAWLRTTSGADVVLVPKTGFFGRGSILRVPYGQRVGQARAVGTRRALQVVDVFMPESTRAKVAAGDRVTAGRTALASLS
ncbi:hypothetical protein [Algiphilus sp.]|uniref:hypothetical protein n=1 Tax=Algiphilus sp. TaxID=1872431 RepID=UPI003C6898CB